ncbi:3'-5' exonuclease [Carboxylicivirga mesophila]|uniref:3'-5' exonuclease n=1 Tax=Carboxylicivirga mesophila TaxID=1166478 RepID=A0ABS5K9F3_9BACT|nr:3'-5' exonuclease [Carboxylicivirga mesophila]MBS2211633.1 3'-5' exonuclease [Carboxylicivirga mesophila]
MLDAVRVEDIMFLDIETVPQEASFENVTPELQVLWDKKSAYFRAEDESAGDVYGRAGIYAEFGKIVCISVGVISARGGKRIFRVKSFAGDNEKVLLEDFGQMLNGFARDMHKNICGHNAKEFDFPYIARRMLINGVKLPPILDVAGKKPWEVKFMDTMDMWKFGDYKHYTSLNLLTTIFDIPSPKDDIDGSQVAQVFYEERDVERIARYCEKDVLATAQLFLRFKGEELIAEDAVEHA